MMRVAKARFKTRIALSPVLTLEIAHEPEDRARGLMGRVFLPMDRGMLFVFEELGHPSFWMKDTLMPLDIAWLSDAGVVQEVAQLMPKDERSRSPKQLTRYAIEMPLGAFKQYYVQPGDRLLILPKES